MPQQIDSIGAFTGEILESVVGKSSGGFPQWVVRLKVEKKYVEEKSELEHFGLSEPAWVDYSSFDYETVAFLVLFNATGALLNYEQVQLATGWDGADFGTLADAVGKKILFRTESNTYNDKTTIRVSWVDAEGANPVRSLKAVDATEIKSLNAQFITKKAKVTPAAAAPTGKPAAPKAAKTTPKAPAAKPIAPAPVTQTVPSVAAPTAAPAVAKPPKVVPPPPAAVVEEDTATAGLPAETDKLGAWGYVMEHKGENDDSVITDSFCSAMSEVADNRAEKDLTEKDWAKIRDTVIKDCALST